MIHHAKSEWDEPGASDFERSLSEKGRRDVKTLGSYLKLRGIRPDSIVSSCALRAQQTADGLADLTGFKGRIQYLNELYFTPPETMLQVLLMQDDEHDSLFFIGYNPQLTALANLLSREHIGKIPSMGILALKFSVDTWEALETHRGAVDFMIFPKQFRYYMPQQIRATLDLA